MIMIKNLIKSLLVPNYFKSYFSPKMEMSDLFWSIFIKFTSLAKLKQPYACANLLFWRFVFG